MNKHLLALVIASTLGLTACGDDATVSGDPTLDPTIGESLKAETKIKFDLISDPANPIIVTPTFLAMDTVDGTIKTDGDVGTQGYLTDISDPSVALGKTDGWSTNQPILIEFMGNDLDPATAQAGFYLLETADPTSADYANTAPTPLTAANGDFMVTASGTTLTIIPLKPFKPASQYQFAITADLKDAKGNPVGMSNTYAVLKSTTPTPDMALEPAQQIAHLSEATFAAVGVDKDTIIFTNWFTTASVGDVMYAAKAASALALSEGAENVWTGTAISDDVSASDLAKMFNMTFEPSSKTTTAAGNLVYTGTVSLPYYLETNPATFASTPWQSGMPSLAKIKHVLANGSDADKATVMPQLTALGITTDDLENVATDPAIQLRILPRLTGQTITLSDGSPLDEERLITRYSPVPKLKSVQDVEYTVILPSPANNPTCQQAEANSVTIFQHGITSSKEILASSALPDTIIGNNCNAIFAIDLPLHGTRGIETPTGTINASSDPSIYLNLSYLPVGRDNLRQSITDQVNLRVAIGRLFFNISEGNGAAMGPLGWLNPASGVDFVGHSLGAMTGVDLGYVANRSMGDQQADAVFFNINKLALANPGAGIPYLLLGSGNFGNFVKGNLLAASSDEFKQSCDNPMAYPICYGLYEKGLIESGTEESLAKLAMTYSLFSQFAYAAQTILDTVDPLNHAPLISDTTPVYLSMTQGDTTIPNALPVPGTPGSVVEGTTILQPYSPFAGTVNLVSETQLGLTPTTSSLSGDSPLKAAAFFTVGGHSSFMAETFLAPGKPATAEMQGQAASLINGNGTSLTVTNSDILSLTPTP